MILKLIDLHCMIASVVMVHRREHREFLFRVSPNSDPEPRISPQMTQIAQIKRLKDGSICVICDICG
jgi:hypothetical protein